MDRTAKEARVYGIFQEISQSYDRANERISLGLHRRWKRMLTGRLIESLPAGSEVLDVCCGTGDIGLEIAKNRKDVQVTGLDFSPAMLEVAERRRKGLQNIHFMQGNALELPVEGGRFAAACISFGLRNTADYAGTLAELKRAVRSGGSVYCLDSFVPEGKLVRPFYRFYFHRIMPRLGGGRNHAASYRWLYESTEQFLRREELEALFRTGGLMEVRSERRMSGACAMVWGRVPEECTAETDRDKRTAEKDRDERTAETDPEERTAGEDPEERTAETDREKRTAETDREKRTAETDREERTAEKDREKRTAGEDRGKWTASGKEGGTL